MIRDVLKNSIIRLKYKDTFEQAIRYFFVGGICTLLDVGLLYLLTTYLGVNYLLSSAISFMSGAILNYFLCIIWIFKIRVVENKMLEFLFYIIITLVGLGINTCIIWCLTTFFFFYYILSKLVAIFFTYWWNFLARKYFLHTIR
jgi:putative flippase GtrA